MSGLANLQVLGATSEDVCEYYGRGLLARGVDYDAIPPYLEDASDPLDSDGMVALPQRPGLGHRINWDYVNEHRSEEHTSELQSHLNLVCRLLLEKKKINFKDIALPAQTPNTQQRR